MKDERPEFAKAIRKARGEKESADATAQGIKAEYDSINSLINIAQDNADRAPSESDRRAFYERVTALTKERDALKAEFDEANQTKDEAARAVTKAEADLRTIEEQKAREIADYMLTHPAEGKKLMDYSAGEVKTLGDVEDNLKKATREFDLLAKLAAA